MFDEAGKKVKSFFNRFWKNRQGRIVSAFLLTVMIILPAYFFFFSQKTEAAWWNDLWMYRKKIIINENSSLSINKHPVFFEIDTASLISGGKMKNDGADIRVTDINSNLVVHQIDIDTINTANTKIWLLLETGANEDKTFYVYYGNLSADAENYQDKTDLKYVIESNSRGYFENSQLYAEVNNDPDGNGWGFIDIHAVNQSDIVNNHTFLFSRDDDAEHSITLSDSGPIYLEFTFVGSGYERNSGPLIYRLYAYNSFLRWMVNDSSVVSGETYWFGWDNSVFNTWESNGTSYALSSTQEAFEFNNISHPYVREMRSSDNYSIVLLAPSAQINKARVSGNISNGSDETMGLSNMTSTISLPWLDYWFGIASQDECEDLGDIFSNNSSGGSVGSEEKSVGPVAYWSFDEGTGTTANDGTSNGNDGAITGAVWKNEDECVSGKCLWFDGVDDYVDVGNEAAHDFSGDFSINFWVKTFQTEWKTIIGKHTSYGDPGGAGTGWGIYTHTSVGGLRGYFRNGSSVGLTDTEGTNDGNWHYMSYSRSGSDISFYEDGNLVGSVSLSGDLNNSVNLTIGKGYQYFKGFIDEIKIYNYARTATQIKQDYNAGLAGIGTSKGISAAIGGESRKWMTDGLVGHWKMDEASWNGTAEEVVDSSGNGLNGVRVSTANTGVGRFGRGAIFNGGTDAVTLNATHTPGNGDWTVSAWVKTSGNGTILSNNSGGPVTNDMKIMDGKITYASYYSSWVNNSGTTTINDGTWHLLTWVNYVSQKMDLFVDGKLESGSGFSSRTNNGGPVNSIGRNWSSSMTGSIDDIRIYNRALSPQEITDLYNYAPGPVGHWKMDDGSGTTAVDSSGNGNSGTLQNSPGWVTSGKYGGGINFNGSGKRVTLGTPISQGGYTTVSLWYKRSESDSSTTWRTLIGHASANIHHLISNSSSRNLGIWDGSFRDFGYNPPDDGAWHHYEVIYNSGTNATLYVDGVYKNQISTTLDLAANPIGSIGNWNSGNYWAGQIDDVRIYNYARTPKQIVEDMNAGHPAGGSPVGSQVGYWKFDEGYGTTANNSGNGGSAINGTISGATWTNDGKFGKALSFDGTDDYVDCTNNSSLRSDYISVSAWVKPTDLSIARDFLGKTWAYSGDLYWMRINSNGTVTWYFGTADNVMKSVTSSATISLNQWAHVVATFDGSKAYIYINGKRDSNSLSISPSQVLGASNYSLFVGRRGYGAINFFQGQIDEVKVYSYALMEDEVKLDYDQGKSLVMGSAGTESDGKTPSQSASRAYCVPGDTATCNPPIAEWKLDEMTGTTANDTSGNNRHLAFTNTPSWYATGKVGSALDFDNDDYVSYDWTDFSLVNQTIEFWMKADTINASWRDLVGTTLNSDYNRFHLDATDNSIKWYNYVGAVAVLDSNVIPVAGQWYHVVGTYDGTTVKVYVNGQLKNSASASIVSYTATGAWVGGTTEDFDGQIDDVRIYNYARTPAQVAWDYNRGKPVGWWKMDEGEGSTVYDHSGNANNGTMTNMDPATDWVDGKNNKALDFDGSNDYVVTNNYKFSSGDMTISAWFKPETFPSDWAGVGCFRYNSGTSGTGWQITPMASSVKLVVGRTGMNYTTNTFSGTIPTNSWSHILATYQGGVFKVYLNGEKIGSDWSQSVVYGGAGDNFHIGRWSSDYNGYYFDGQIDDVRVYNYALTAEQVKQIMNEGAVNFK